MRRPSAADRAASPGGLLSDVDRDEVTGAYAGWMPARCLESRLARPSVAG
jgi:hypothetical protein